MSEDSRAQVLGALALIDDGEIDWKLIALSTGDPLSVKASMS